MFLLWLLISMPVLVLGALIGLAGALWKKMICPYDVESPAEKQEGPKEPEK